jgi:hypothetical protein
VLVEGEPGIGKSALVQAAVTLAPEGDCETPGAIAIAFASAVGNIRRSTEIEMVPAAWFPGRMLNSLHASGDSGRCADRPRA